MNIKTTTKRGIRHIFDKVTCKQWEHFFAREQKNGLYIARKIDVTAKTAIPAQCVIQYNIEMVAQWLVNHGYYTPKDIRGILE